jgi:hypothetical protein
VVPIWSQKDLLQLRRLPENNVFSGITAFSFPARDSVPLMVQNLTVGFRTIKCGPIIGPMPVAI